MFSLSSNYDGSFYLLVKIWDHNRTHNYILSLLTYDAKMLATSDGEDISFAVKNVDLPCNDSGYYIYSQYYGIICLVCFDNQNTVVIANPGIREFRTLPESCIPIPSSDYESRLIAVGSGFDLKTNDYKVVKILTLESCFNPVEYRQAEVYSLRSNSWRQIEYFNAKIIGPGGTLSCDRNGACYWIVNRVQENDYARGLLSFDLSEEAFQFTEFPNYLRHTLSECHSYARIIEFDETIAIISCPSGMMEKCFNIWVMDEFGINRIWTKVLSIGPFLGVDTPLLLRRNELLVLLSSEQVASYNIVTKEMRKLPIDGGHVLCFQALIYKSSLLSFNIQSMEEVMLEVKRLS